MRLQSYLQSQHALIDATLERVLPSAEEPPRRIHEAMRYMVFSGGKRLRPILCLASAGLAGAPEAAALLPSAAVELLHTYTLIHDDLPCMDDDDWRRGKATCHVAYGEAHAILAGDALQALAFHVVAGTSVPPGYGPNPLILELAEAAGSRGVIGGQARDIEAEVSPPSLADIEAIHRHKTADLFRAAMRMGAIAGGADPETLRAATDYGLCLGLAFQITDDLLDAGTTDQATESAGPSPSSCLSVYDPAAARAKAEELVSQAISALAGADKDGRAPLEAIAHFILSRDR